MLRCGSGGWGVWVSGTVRYMGVVCLGKWYGALHGVGCLGKWYGAVHCGGVFG